MQIFIQKYLQLNSELKTILCAIQVDSNGISFDFLLVNDSMDGTAKMHKTMNYYYYSLFNSIVYFA